MIDPKRLPENTRQVLRSQLEGRMEGMRNDRMSWWAHWAQLAEVLLPRRYRWFINPNQWNRGSQMNAAIVDETGVIAARTCASGMLAGMTSPTRTWFRMALHDLGELPPGDEKNWLAECTRRMMRVMNESNFYQSLGTLYHDLTCFNSASMIVYEDRDQVICCHNPCLGEFFFAVGKDGKVDSHYREFTLTVTAAVDQFGLEALPLEVQQTYKQGGANRTREIVVCHAIEPNTDLWQDAALPLGRVVPLVFKFREIYWIRGAGTNHLVQIAGYKGKPFVGARWNVTSNDAYGSGPGMDALPALRQLQIEQRRKAEAIDKLVRPPMVASINMRNEPSSTLPGGITYAADLGPNSGFKPAYQVEPRIQEMTNDILEVQTRVKSIFFVDLFMMISSLDTVRTATEVDARKEEKLIQLGPVIERFENEVLDPLIDRIFDIMLRRGLIPPPPESIRGRVIDIQYISMLAEAQRAASTAGLERLWQVSGNLVGVVPDIMDNIDNDLALERYSDYLQVDPEVIRSLAQVAQIRQQRAQQQAAQAAMAAAPDMAAAGKTLSETEVGGGRNALESMMQ